MRAVFTTTGFREIKAPFWRFEPPPSCCTPLPGSDPDIPPFGLHALHYGVVLFELLTCVFFVNIFKTRAYNEKWFDRSPQFSLTLPSDYRGSPRVRCPLPVCSHTAGLRFASHPMSTSCCFVSRDWNPGKRRRDTPCRKGDEDKDRTRYNNNVQKRRRVGMDRC